ncbi:MAG: ArsR/SmtB family transcription factor [Flavobacteriaceae bacterium]
MGIVKTELFSNEQNELADILKVLGHPARIAIIDYIKNSSSCINTDLVQELGLAQPTISQHLKELKRLDFIIGSIQGKSISYCLDNEKWNEANKQITTWLNKPETIKSKKC